MHFNSVQNISYKNKIVRFMNVTESMNVCAFWSEMSIILFVKSQGNIQLFLGIASVLTGYVITIYM